MHVENGMGICVLQDGGEYTDILISDNYFDMDTIRHHRDIFRGIKTLFWQNTGNPCNGVWKKNKNISCWEDCHTYGIRPAKLVL